MRYNYGVITGGLPSDVSFASKNCRFYSKIWTALYTKNCSFPPIYSWVNHSGALRCCGRERKVFPSGATERRGRSGAVMNNYILICLGCAAGWQHGGCFVGSAGLIF